MDKLRMNDLNNIILEVKEIMAFLAVALDNYSTNFTAEEISGMSNIVKYCHDLTGGIPEMLEEE